MLCVLLALLLGSIVSAQVPAQSAGRHPKAVVVVIDDSGSMMGGARWVRANYALKTLAALLDESDALLIQPLNARAMGPFSGTAGVRRAIDDLDRFRNRRDAGTPYAPVSSALNALLARPEAEKWLIVITDGGFNSLDPADDTRNRERAVQAGVHSAFIMIEQENRSVPEAWHATAGTALFEARKIDDVYPKLREAATWLNGQTDKGLQLKAEGDHWVFDSAFPLRRLTLLRQDSSPVEIRGATISGETIAASSLRQHRIRTNEPVTGLNDSRVYHLRAQDGRVINAGAGVIRVDFAGDAKKVSALVLPDVAAAFSVAIGDAQGNELPPDATGVITICDSSYRVIGKLTDDQGKPLLTGRSDQASFHVDATIGGARHPLPVSGEVFTAAIASGPAGSEALLLGNAEYPGYLHKTSAPLKLRFGTCKRTVAVDIAGGIEGNHEWRTTVDNAGRLPPVRLASTLNGAPVSAEEFAQWQLVDSGAPGFVIEKSGTEWIVRPETAPCCVLFWKRPSPGSTVLSFVRLNTGMARDDVTLPSPITFTLDPPAGWLRQIWWYACPFVYVGIAGLLMWYLLRLFRKTRFGSSARLWMHEPATGMARGELLRKRAGFLKRWLWPTERESARIDSLILHASGYRGSMIRVDGRSLEERHDIEGWTFNEARRDKGEKQSDANLRDGSTIRVLAEHGTSHAGIERRYQYARSGKQPEGW